VTSENSLRFSVEDSVWFKRGQEVSELVSMSLDPDITVQEHDQYVSIRGALLLSGEYVADNENRGEEDNESSSLQEYASVRTIDYSHVGEEGNGELNHRFPVDITIPMDRVENLDDVYVTIASFDYEFPERSCLQLSADITISGILGETKGSTNAESQQNDRDDVIEQEGNVEQLFKETEVKKTPELDEETELSNVEEDNFELQQTESEERADSSPQIEMKGRASEDEWTTNRLGRADTKVNEKKNEPQSSIEDNEDGDSKDENALYLTKIFGREEEDFSKLKMYIVQGEDSLSLIADRYEVSVAQLLRVNELDHEDVSEGQILYIPVASPTSI
jgi:stage VI sporulation protein D